MIHSPFLKEFRSEQQVIRRQDAAAYPRVMDELQRRGVRYPEATLQELLHEVDERAAMDQVAEWLRKNPDTGSIISHEHDGAPVLDSSGVGDDAWKQRLVDGAQQQTGLEFAVKPYRSEAMIWALLRHEHPELDWDTQDLDAYQLEYKRVQLKYYMHDGRSQPDMLVGELIGAQPAPDNSAVLCRDVFRTLADARDIEVAAYNEDSHSHEASSEAPAGGGGPAGGGRLLEGRRLSTGVDTQVWVHAAGHGILRGPDVPGGLHGIYGREGD